MFGNYSHSYRMALFKTSLMRPAGKGFATSLQLHTVCATQGEEAIMQAEQGTCGKGTLGAHLSQQQQAPSLLLAHLSQQRHVSSTPSISADMQLSEHDLHQIDFTLLLLLVCTSA